MAAVDRGIEFVDPREMRVVTAHVAAVVAPSALVGRLESGAQPSSPERLAAKHPDPPRLLKGVGVGQLFHHDRVNSGDLELGRQRQPDWARSDYEDLTVNLRVLHVSLRVTGLLAALHG
jgi:hypothetical protein